MSPEKIRRQSLGRNLALPVARRHKNQQARRPAGNDFLDKVIQLLTQQSVHPAHLVGRIGQLYECRQVGACLAYGKDAGSMIGGVPGVEVKQQPHLLNPRNLKQLFLCT